MKSSKFKLGLSASQTFSRGARIFLGGKGSFFLPTPFATGLSKTQIGTSCEKWNSKAFRLGIEPASSGLLDQCSTTELQKSLPTTWLLIGSVSTTQTLIKP